MCWHWLYHPPPSTWLILWSSKGNVGRSRTLCLPSICPHHITNYICPRMFPFSTKSTQEFHYSFVHECLRFQLLIFMVLPGWLCEREPEAQACLYLAPFRNLPCKLGAAAVVPRHAHRHPMLLVAGPSPTLPTPIGTCFCFLFLLLPCINYFDFCFACDYWKSQTIANKEIYS